MADPAYSLAVQGGTPEPLPYTGRGIVRSLQRIGGDHVTLDGSTITDRVAVKRVWVLPYRWLSDAQYNAVEAWLRGDHGLGPFELRERGGSPVLVNVVSVTCGVTLLGSVSDAVLTLREG